MKNDSSGGIGFFGLLTITFIVLKLAGVVTWSWFWVLSPVIFGFTILLIAIILSFLLRNR